ncbi:hypothetical protein C8F01DRAFT_1379111 [Mycena amicta]|nr:hypothetical protein C8F01DRAFT_1379111 [Mycena amicta]
MSYKNPSRLATLNIPARSPPYVPHPQPRTTYPIQIPAVPRSLIGTKGWKDQISKDLHAPKVVVTRCAKTGRPMVYDEGYAMRELNEDAPEFVPRFLTPKGSVSVVGSARPSPNSSRAPSPSPSVASVSSRTSSTLASASIKSLWSSSSRGTSRGTTPEPEPSKSRATSPLPFTPTTARPLIRELQPATPSTARPLHLSAPAPQLPPADPVELLYKHYREELRVAKDIVHPIRALLETGVEPMQAKIIAALVVRLSSSSSVIRGGKDVFLPAVRAQALDLFRGHWENRAIWQNEPRGDHDYLTSRGVNIAGLLGSLFAVGTIPYSDIHRCVVLLVTVADKPAFLKLMAVHALLVHAGPAFCAGEAREHAKTVLAPVCEVDERGRLVWGPHEESHVLVADLMQTFQAWLGH